VNEKTKGERTNKILEKAGKRQLEFWPDLVPDPSSLPFPSCEQNKNLGLFAHPRIDLK